MSVVDREKVRRAVQVALHLDPHHNLEDAVDAVAQALGLPREAVLQAIEPVGEETTA